MKTLDKLPFYQLKISNEEDIKFIFKDVSYVDIRECMVDAFKNDEKHRFLVNKFLKYEIFILSIFPFFIAYCLQKFKTL